MSRIDKDIRINTIVSIPVPDDYLSETSGPDKSSHITSGSLRMMRMRRRMMWMMLMRMRRMMSFFPLWSKTRWIQGAWCSVFLPCKQIISCLIAVDSLLFIRSFCPSSNVFRSEVQHGNETNQLLDVRLPRRCASCHIARRLYLIRERRQRSAGRVALDDSVHPFYLHQLSELIHAVKKTS